jgi:sugar phosphate isomerase/epimerase
MRDEMKPDAAIRPSVDLAEINMRSVRRSLVELAEHAARLGIRLGLENRSLL